jgi:uncharacterized protein (UPF0332 family)
MTFDPEHFLNLAKGLVDDSNYDEEARYRTAISRAYYATHLISKKKLEDIGVKFPIEDDKNMGIIHMMVIDYLIKRNDPIGRMLKGLRKNRNKADYNLDWKFKKKGVELLISEAEVVSCPTMRITIENVFLHKRVPSIMHGMKSIKLLAKKN